MTDTLTPEERSRTMSKIRSKDTGPELAMRKLIHSMGYRFRLYGKVSRRFCKSGFLPGKPDLVLAKYKTVIFVNGCFWHRHKNCKLASIPKSHEKFWQEKFRRNVARDKETRKQLRAMGWRVITIWECELRNPAKIKARIRRQLSSYDNCGDKSLIAAEKSGDYGSE